MMNWCCGDFIMIWIGIRNMKWMMMIVLYLPVLWSFIVTVILMMVVGVMVLLGMTKLGSVV